VDGDDETSEARNEVARSLSDPAFLAAVGHDLRGPLGAIGTWIHVLASGRADAATQQQALAAMQRDVAQQGRLIAQLTDLASILGGTLTLSIEEVDLAAMLEEWGVRRGDGRRERALADPRRLRELLAILLGAPEEGGPALTVREDAAGVLSIAGLSSKGGPGRVGLTLARALAELQGGHLRTRATPEGMAFAVELPRPGTAA
jgi:signal transduction histidine kinase